MRGVLRQRMIALLPSLSGEDAIRAGCAEAKILVSRHLNGNQDAIRAGCAEAKELRTVLFIVPARCNPCGVC